MLYRQTRDHTGLPPALDRAPYRGDRRVAGAGGWGRLVWLRGQHTNEKCPACSEQGPHQLQLSVPSSITPDQFVIFARCRRCDSRFVVDYQPAAYEAAPANDAPLRFYVEQGAGIETLARAVFVAAQEPVRNYLDIGCGFGFGPDMATRIFGWDAVGLDPGPIAAAGREMLGVRIETDLLTTEKRLAGAPYDVIVATEVIEHIVRPHVFLRAVRNNLSDNGILILTTPNGRYLDSSPDGDMLLPILSPGYHTVLYSSTALAALLEETGFSNRNVMSTSASLFAVAAPTRRPLHADVDINRGRYIGYLRSRFRDGPRGSPIHIGFGYRLLRSLTEAQAYDEAVAVFADLRETLLGELRIDIDRPLDIAGQVSEQDVAFAVMPEKYPFCLAGLLYCRGTIAAAHEHRAELAAAYFLATRFAAQMLLRSLDAIGSSDADLASLPTLAANALLSSLEIGELR
jgi:cyclopropane fatty-acyl-phospholipid synthase-like methyltransferase